MVKFLEIGAGRETSQLETCFGFNKEVEITTLDINPAVEPNIVSDARQIYPKLKDYDIIFASNVLNYVPWYETGYVLKNWSLALKDEGELHIIVPSAEWIGEQLISEKPTWIINYLLFGTLGQNGASGIGAAGMSSFTMRQLRGYGDLAGLKTISAKTGPVEIEIDGFTWKYDSHYVLFSKKEHTGQSDSSKRLVEHLEVKNGKKMDTKGN
jgi:hypothetical protein